MKAMIRTLVVGTFVSVLTLTLGGESVRAFAPFAVLSTSVLLFAFWSVARDHTPVTRIHEYRKAA